MGQGWLLGNPLADGFREAVGIELPVLPRRKTILADPAGVVTPAGPGGGGHLSGANGLPGCAVPGLEVLYVGVFGDGDDVAQSGFHFGPVQV